MMDRRELIQKAAMLLGGAVSASAMAGVLAGCVSTPEATSGKQTFFTPSEMRTATAVADQILPRTDTPGAIDVGVPAFMDKMMAGYYREKQRSILRAGLERMDRDAMTAYGQVFTALSVDQQVALMKVYDREAYELGRRNINNPDADPHFFRILKELTIVGFCTSEVGATKFLTYAAIPGPYRADIPYSEIGKAWAT
ncbi:MAG: gluconate 2-dehydrogenase subunit 3 family protein [Hyphomonadaceae bacterium]|nr:gluconate 2-dehydrogenase subunit 3 family protein [Hyphomonadaceae bacterium]